MYGEQTWASRQREAKRAERKEIAEGITLMALLLIGMFLYSFI